MITIGPGPTATCKVFTLKEGLLSAIAHDLEIDVTRFEIRIADDRASVEATFDPTSLRVRGAVRDGVFVPGVLGDADLRKIERTLMDEVLEARTYPRVRFQSRLVTATEGGHRVEGELELHGRTRPLVASTRSEGAGVESLRLALHQPDFGVTPYRAMLGTLKVQPTVRIELRVSLPG